MELQYPIVVLAHEGGYASIVEEKEAVSRHSLIVLTNPEDSLDLMQRLGIIGAPRLINNAREFRWLLESLQDPVTHVAFDVDPVEDQANAKWSTSIENLLEAELVADFSPWNYPIYSVVVEDGFLSITGQREDDTPLHAIVVFRSHERAKNYIEAAGGGDPHTLNNLSEAVEFFQALSESVDAVALDPIIEEGRCQTPICFAIDTLLTKYLVEDEEEE